jgi:hypothetical protein
MQQQDSSSIDDEIRDVQDLVEPVRWPRIRAAVIEPFFDRHRLSAAERAGIVAYNPSYRCYREWKLVGIREDGDGTGDGDGGGGGDAAPDISSPLLDRLAARLTSDSSPPAPTEGRNDDGITRRFLSLLLHNRPETRVIWLSRGRFLACDGPRSHGHDGRDGWWSHVAAFRADVTTTTAAVEGDNAARCRHHRICLGALEEDRAAGDWPPVLAALLARCARVTSIACQGLDVTGTRGSSRQSCRPPRRPEAGTSPSDPSSPVVGPSRR